MVASPLVEPIPRVASLRMQAYELMRAAIIAGDIVPGRLYSVNQFTELLGVSRTPIREALLELDRQGILRLDRNRGFWVVPMTETDLREITDLRRLIEIPAMERLAGLRPAPTEALRRGREIYADLQRAATAGDLLSYLSVDRRFHLNLVAALDNSRLTKLIGELRDHMQLPGLRRLTEGEQLHESAREHLALLEAIEAGDPVRAAAVMSAHLDRTEQEWAS